jgi:DMSO/TMAO reductase YedYZ molybdopterin-dependent catalytic subunit
MEALDRKSVVNAPLGLGGKAKGSWVVGLFAGFIAAAAMTALMFWGLFRFGTPFPPALLAEKIFAITPMQVFGFFIRLLGKSAKPLAFYSAVATYVAIGAALGAFFPILMRRVSSRRIWLDSILYSAAIWVLTMLLFMPLVGVGFWGTNLQQGALWGGFSLLIYHLIYGILLGFGYLGFSYLALSRSGRRRETARNSIPADAPANPERREMLKKLAVGLIVFGAASSILGLLQKAANYSLALAQELFAKIKGLSPEITPTPDFYTVSKNVFDPTVDASRWKLEVKGLVEEPYKLTYDELKSLPSVEQYANLICISNPVGGDLVGNARWKGVPLKNLLNRAKVKPQANEIILKAEEGYTDSFPLAKGMTEGTILAYEMNGAPLEPKHGFPARLIVPGIYGMKNVKWLNAIELADYDYKGFWERRGWSDEAIIKTMSRIDTPQHMDALKVGQKVYIAGIAFAGIRGIKGVEVSTDGGFTYNKTTAKDSISPYSWTLWAYEWEPKNKGDYTIIVRATDGTGEVQTADRRDSLPEGATGRHTIKVRVA